MDDLIPLRINGDLDSDHFAAVYQPLVSQVKQLDKSIPELQGEIDFEKIRLTSTDYVLKEAKELYNEWSKMLFPQKRAIVETITEYVTVEKDNVIVAISHLSSGSPLTSQHDFTLAGSGNPGFSDGFGAAATFDYVINTTVDAAGNVYVADAGNHSIRKITPAGQVKKFPLFLINI